MGTRQYVGARYVPKVFEYNGSSNWVSGIAYEPLTIVTYLNNSYTSKKPVPSSVGSPNENPEYWANTGDYSGTVSNLTDMVNALSDRVGTTENDITALNTEVTKLTTGKRIVLISDSYGNYGNSENKTFITLVKEGLGLVQDVSFFYANNGGASFRGSTNTYLELLQGLTIANHDTITDIYVVGGANDASRDIASVKNGIKAFSDYVKANYVNAKFHIIPVGITFTDEYISFYKDGESIALNESRAYGVRVCENAQYCLMDGTLLRSDLVHPSETGVDKIAECVIGYITTGVYSVCRTIRAEGSSIVDVTIPNHSSETIASKGLSLLYEQVNGIIKISPFNTYNSMTCMEVTLTNNITLARNDTIVFSPTERHIVNYLYGSTRKTVACEIVTNADERIPAEVKIRTTNADNQIIVRALKGAESAANVYNVAFEFTAVI